MTVNYIFFVSREIWPAFNSIYAYAVLKKTFPENLIALYIDEENMRVVERMLHALYEENGRILNLKKVRIQGDYREAVKAVLEDVVREGDVIDITGARKIMILSLLSLHGVRVVYLLLRDMTFSGTPFMMRPLSVQSLEEVLM